VYEKRPCFGDVDNGDAAGVVRLLSIATTGAAYYFFGGLLT